MLTCFGNILFYQSVFKRKCPEKKLFSFMFRKKLLLRKNSGCKKWKYAVDYPNDNHRGKTEMKKDSEEQYKMIRKLRLYYSIAVPVILLLTVTGWIIHLNSTMPSRSLVMQLQRAKNSAQLEQILRESSINLDADRLAEVYINCALAAFTDKDYDEACKLLQNVIRSKAHPELRASARYELANACFLAGHIQEGFQQLNVLLSDPEVPQEFKEKAQEIQQFVNRELKR